MVKVLTTNTCAHERTLTRIRALIRNGENTVVNRYVDAMSKLLMLLMFPVPKNAMLPKKSYTQTPQAGRQVNTTMR